MPILAPELSLYPADLFDRADAGVDTDERWWALYSLPRQEKQLMRRLHAQCTPFYAPVVARRTRAPSGRVRVSHVPLFSGYVFLYGTGARRHAAMTTNCVSRCLDVADGRELTRDLRDLPVDRFGRTAYGRGSARARPDRPHSIGRPDGSRRSRHPPSE